MKLKTNLILLLLIFQTAIGIAQTTNVIVRAKAKDAKFLPATLGVHVTIKNNMTGEVMAKGMATGGSGNTELIMADAISRGQQLADEGTSKFMATLELTEPTFVDVEVYASTNRRNGTKKVTTQVWLIPGKHIVGDGIVVEIPGFIVDILSPTTQQYTRLSTIADGKMLLKASITMACGCVISKGGTWNSDDFTINAIIKRNGTKVTEVPLKFTGVWNNFEVILPVNEKGDYEVHVYAYDPKTGNTGLDKINFTIF
ncbi:hypothetical protein [Pedobacter frigoris]|uniref:DUF1573 domain-containing protein n=1 Tax=Pedobacter frigoris TaxID=2571272 RepID=A0A4U1CS46_9SPHI|nr:hypothetical protein [Pedobacter frigoris]TKC08538.1 hypothetical protein FA047_00095 [Pedobacter frigoris]